MDLPDLKRRKRMIQQQYGARPGIQGFGVGDQTIRVYVRSPEVKTALEAEMPAHIDGIPLEIEVTGDIEAR